MISFQMNVISVRKGEIYPRSSLPREDFTARYSQWKFILIEGKSNFLTHRFKYDCSNLVKLI